MKGNHHRGKRNPSDVVQRFLIEEGFMQKVMLPKDTYDDEGLEQICNRCGYLAPISRGGSNARAEYLEEMAERMSAPNSGIYSMDIGFAGTSLGQLESRPSTNMPSDFHKTNSGPMALSSHDIDPKGDDN